jgi:hypothetical protein
MMVWKNLALATGLFAISLLSAGANVMNHEGAPRYEIRDQISFLMYFFEVMEP